MALGQDHKMTLTALDKIKAYKLDEIIADKA